MKKIVLIGKSGCGKTTLCQRIFKEELEYKKTQSVEVVGGSAIDTPGEYMATLTVITAIFLPLTLLVGWYGMNFAYMPELNFRYGYLIIFLVSIIIIVLEILFFKKKHFID